MRRTRLDLSLCGAVITGASKGVGVVLAEALAARGARLVLAARDEAALEAVAARLRATGAQVEVVPTDVSDPASLHRLAERSLALLGSVELLVNNAGVDSVGHYAEAAEEDIHHSLQVNLAGPMLLTRLLLPQMLEHGRGHVVNIASLAGLAPSAFNEPYCATKHGLVGFTLSLRASLQAMESNVSASVICPGFISDAGMYATQSKQFGVSAPGWLGTVTPEAVARAVLDAIASDRAEAVVSRTPVRPLLMLRALAPKALEWLVRALNANALFRKVADARRLPAGTPT